MAIFTHTDSDGDFMEIVGEDGDPQEDLVVRFSSPRPGRRAVWLDRDAEDRLYAALTKRIGERDGEAARCDGTACCTPHPMDIESDRVGPGPDPIYTALVRRLVAEEVARVRESVVSLRSSPQAAVPATTFPYTSCHREGLHDRDGLCSDCVRIPEPDAEDGWRSAPDFCTIPDCDRSALGQADHLEHDLEPRDVGHPQPTDWSDRLWNGEPVCTAVVLAGVHVNEVHEECGHLWAIHRAAPKPRLMAEMVPVRDMEPAAAECTCEHPAGQHSLTSGGCDYLTCDCTWAVRP